MIVSIPCLGVACVGGAKGTICLRNVSIGRKNVPDFPVSVAFSSGCKLRRLGSCSGTGCGIIVRSGSSLLSA